MSKRISELTGHKKKLETYAVERESNLYLIWINSKIFANS
jgi:hypothetical protein